MADGRVVIDSELNDKGLEKGLQDLQGKLQKTGDKVKGVGKKLSTHLTLPLTAAAGFAIKLGMDFEQGMAQVAAVSGATASEMEAMEAQAKELGETTKFSALDAASGMEFLARAGFDANEVMAAMPGLLDLAAASSMDLGVAADVASNILSGFGMAADEAGRVADVLAFASKSANTDVVGMGEAMKYVAPVAASLGLSVEETAAAVGFLADAGIQGGQAGTVLRAGLLRLASPTDAVAGLMEELGMEMFDAEGNMKALPDVIKELENGLEGMSSQQKLATLETMFGAQAVSGWSNIIERGSEELGVFTDELNNSEGAAAEMAAIISGTTLGAIDELTSALEGTALRIYESLQPAINFIIEALTKVVKWFNGLSDEMISTIVVVGAIVAAIGPLLVILGIVISTIGTVVGALAAITPVTWIVIGAIAAIIAIGVFLYDHLEEIKEKAIEVFSHFEPLMEILKSSFQTMMDHVGPIIENLKNLWESLIPLLQTVGTIIGAVLAVAFGVLVGVINGVIAAIGPLINAFINIVDYAVNMVNAIVALFTGDFAGAFEFLKAAAQSTLDFFVNIFKGLLNFLGGFIDGVIGFFHGLYMTLVGNSIIPDMVNAIVRWFKNLFKWALDIVRNIVSGITNIFGSLGGIVSKAFNAVRNAVSSGIRGALNVVTGMAKNFLNAGRNIVTSIADGIKGAIGKVTGAISNVTKKIRDFLPFSPAKEGPLMDIHRLNFKGPIEDSIEDAIPDVQAKMNAMLQVPTMQPGINRAPQGTQQTSQLNGLVGAINSLANRPVSIQIDGEEIIKATVDGMDGALNDRFTMKTYMQGIK